MNLHEIQIVLLGIVGLIVSLILVRNYRRNDWDNVLALALIAGIAAVTIVKGPGRPSYLTPGRPPSPQFRPRPPMIQEKWRDQQKLNEWVDREMRRKHPELYPRVDERPPPGATSFRRFE